VTFEDGLVTGLSMQLPKDDPRSAKGDFRPPVDLGMTQGQAEAILGSPTETGTRYPHSAELRRQVCFSQGRAVVSKQIINVIPPPPILH
jgi:hypothetical protein